MSETEQGDDGPAELDGEILKEVKEARRLIGVAVEKLNAVPDDISDDVYQVTDAVSKLEDVISILDEVIPDEEQG